MTELIPFSNDHQRICIFQCVVLPARILDAGTKGVFGMFEGFRVIHCDRSPCLEQQANDCECGSLTNIIGIGFEGHTQIATRIPVRSVPNRAVNFRNNTDFCARFTRLVCKSEGLVDGVLRCVPAPRLWGSTNRHIPPLEQEEWPIRLSWPIP